MSLVTAQDIKDSLDELAKQHNIEVEIKFENAPLGSNSLVYAFLATQVNKAIKDRHTEQIKENVNSIMSKLQEKATQVADIITKA
jgi:hypothetical protein